MMHTATSIEDIALRTENGVSSSVILSDPIRQRITNAVLLIGERPVAKRMRVAASTIARACAGWPIRRGSALQIAAGLEALE